MATLLILENKALVTQIKILSQYVARLDKMPDYNDTGASTRPHVMTVICIFFLRMDVEKGKIEDTGGSGGSYSIKTQFNSEEQWTKALKFMLTNLKWGLAWVTSQFYNR